MVHAIEAYTSALKKNPMSDLFAGEALRLLTSNIRTACQGAGGEPCVAARRRAIRLAGSSPFDGPTSPLHPRRWLDERARSDASRLVLRRHGLR
jgi:alcohol dehydrogenase